MAPVTLPASEQEISAAVAPSLTACARRCACTWPSSAGGVSQTISTGTLCFCDSSFAAASAPVRADRNTGLVELLAIIAIFSPAPRPGASATVGLLPSLLQALARSARAIPKAGAVHFLIVVSPALMRNSTLGLHFLIAGGAPPPPAHGAPPPWLPALALLAPVTGNNK